MGERKTIRVKRNVDDGTNWINIDDMFDWMQWFVSFAPSTSCSIMVRTLRDALDESKQTNS